MRHNDKSELYQSLAEVRSQGDTAQAKLADAQDALSTADSGLATARTQAQTIQTQTKNAMQAAQTKVEAQYAGKLSQVNAEQQQLASGEKTVKAEEGHLEATAISLSGVYAVDQDIKSGTWHMNGDGGGGLMTDACYFATLNSSNTEDIADNNNFDGAEAVNVVGPYAFEINGPCIWYHVGWPALQNAGTTITRTTSPSGGTVSLVRVRFILEHDHIYQTFPVRSEIACSDGLIWSWPQRTDPAVTAAQASDHRSEAPRTGQMR